MNKKTVIKAMGAALIAASSAAVQAVPLTLSGEVAWVHDHTQGGSASNGTEIIARDEGTGNFWVLGPDGVDILDSSGNRINTLDTSALGGANSISIQDGKVAVAIANSDITQPGKVVFYNTSGVELNQVTVGANPDMVTFVDDGRLLVANEGEPDGSNPEGSISIVNTDFSVVTADFTAFNGQEATLRSNGVRIFPGISAAQDLEPEYIAISPDGQKAYATLQENNSLAIIDLNTNQVTDVVSLGTKDHSLPGNGLDASDRDSINGNIQNWNLKGMFMPDAIASYQQNGSTFLVTANEGDARNEDDRIKDLTLDPTAFPNAAVLQQDENLGRLQVSTIDGDTDNDGDFDELYSYGARSFSIWDDQGNLVWDSGDFIERLIIDSYPQLWQEGRSDNKGPEPEGVVLLDVLDHTLAFIGLERSSAILAFDITDPTSPEFLDLLFNDGDIAPEGLYAFSDANGSYLAVANEVSNTTTLYDLRISVPEPSGFALMAAGLLGLRLVRRKK